MADRAGVEGTDSILVDTDPALGLPFADVDDALAIQLLVAARLPVIGLTTCFGNATLERVTRVARELGERFDLPVVAGATRAGDTSTAAAETLARHRGTVLALAPLTNVAAALAMGARWRRLVLLGGTFARRPNLRPVMTTEFNFALDALAARQALPRASHVVTMDVCRAVAFTARDLEPLPEWMARRCRGWLWSGIARMGRRAFHPWDVLAALAIVDPGLFSWRRGSLTLAPRELGAGRLVAVAASGADPASQPLVTKSVDAAAVRDAWHGILGRLPG